MTVVDLWVVSYFMIGFLVQIMWVIVEFRISRWHGNSGWDQLILLIVWPVTMMWPLFVSGVVAELIDGPYEPKHREDLW